jgi:hypothetical protein
MTDWVRQRGEVDRLRVVPLEIVLPLCGATRDRHDPRKWHSAVGTLSVRGAKFMNWQRGVGGGGAIDLVIHLRGGGFGDAVTWLSRHCAGAMTPNSPPPCAQPQLQLPSPEPRNLARMTNYLTGERRIPPVAIETLTRSGDLYPDARANAVFVLRDPSHAAVGAELRGTTGASWRGMAPGSSKDRGFFAVGAPTAVSVVLCESAIDALSILVLFPGHRAISTSGARPRPTWLPQLVAASEVFCGFDADPTGDAMADEMIAAFPAIRRLRPSLHDWNDVLSARS